MRNGGGLKESGLQITPSPVREISYKHEAVGAEELSIEANMEKVH